MEQISTPETIPISLRLLRALMWTHIAFLFLLPFLAVLASVAINERPPVSTFLWGFVPGVVYSTAIVASYRIPASPTGALLLVLAVPAQIALGVTLFDAGPWAFVVEEAFVEIGALATGIGVAMFIHRPTGMLGVAVGAVMIAGSGFAYLPSVLRAYEGAHPGWYLFLTTAFLTAAFFHVRLFSAAAAEFVSSGSPQDVMLKYANGAIARFLGFGDEKETVGTGFDDDKTTVAILIWVGIYVLGGIAVCAISDAYFKS